MYFKGKEASFPLPEISHSTVYSNDRSTNLQKLYVEHFTTTLFDTNLDGKGALLRQNS
jgi:hypothetical protein